MVKGYEKEYHEKQHSYLLNSAFYYNLRARLAKNRYFEDVPGNSNVLEFGIGLGQNVAFMDNKEGFEVSKFAIAFCKKKGIKVYSKEKGIPNNHYDAILCCHVLEHLKNPYEVLTMLKSKLKKDGRLIIVLPKEGHGKAGFEMDINQHLFAWNFRTINNLLAAAGFKVRKNKEHYGTAFYRLRAFAKLGFGLYEILTKMAGRALNRAEIMVEAVKA